MDHFFLIEEKYDFYKKCPCSPKSVSCGYHVVNLGSGCPFECTYCYLQSYLNSPGIVLPANIEDLFSSFRNYKQNIRIGSGEYTDSLAFDHLTHYSPKIVEFFSKYPESTFEFKTKSTNIDLLLSVKSAGNIVVSWSVSPEKISKEVEHLTARMHQRIKAACACVKAGYKVGFHFDPVIHYDGWQQDYYVLVNQIFDSVKEEDIAWMSLGTLRMTPKLKKTVENRFPQNTILDEELVLGYDDKIRYHQAVRNDIYTQMNSWIKKRSKNINIYLCMEEKSMCQQTGCFTK